MTVTTRRSILPLEMVKKRGRRRRPVELIRDVEVTSVDAHVSISPSFEKGRKTELEHKARLYVRGTMNQSIKATREVEFSIHIAAHEERLPLSPSKTAPPAAHIHDTNPYIEITMWVPPATFDRIWTLAVSGGLKYVRFVCAEPHYRRADVTSVWFSTEPNE